MSKHVFVANDEHSEAIELPLEPNNTLLISALTNIFPSATGLKYRNPDGDSFRLLRLAEGRLFPPSETGNSWSNIKFFCVHAKDMKRKGDECETVNKFDQDFLAQCNYGVQSKRVDLKQTSDLIVLGLAWTTDEESMKRYFQQFGEVQMVQVKRNPGTLESKGFGFIRFADYSAQAAVLADKHKIDGRWCTVRIPNSKMEPGRQENDCKIHVRGITEGITSDDLRGYFSEFGVVDDVYIPRPFRSFAFVTFRDPRVASQLIGRELNLRNIHINIGTAAPKNSNPQNNPMAGGGNNFNSSQNNKNSATYNEQIAAAAAAAANDPNTMAAFYASMLASGGDYRGGQQQQQQSSVPNTDHRSDPISALAAMAAQYAAAQHPGNAGSNSMHYQQWADQQISVDQRQHTFSEEYQQNQGMFYSSAAAAAAAQMQQQNPYAIYEQQNYARNDNCGPTFNPNPQNMEVGSYSVASQGIPANLYSQTYGASMHGHSQPMPPGVAPNNYQSPHQQQQQQQQHAYDTSAHPDNSYYQSASSTAVRKSDGGGQASIGQVPAYRRY